MKIQIASYLHIEHFENLKQFHLRYQFIKKVKNNLYEKPIGDILVLAGDIANVEKSSFKEFLNEVSNKFSHVLMVAGNHEFYGNEYYSCLQKMKTICNEFTNVHFLDKTKIEINETIFLGCTLWSYVPTENLTTVNECMNDYHLIKLKNKQLNVLDTCQFFKEDYEWLQSELQKLSLQNNNLQNNTLQNSLQNNNKKVVVITHHAPLTRGVSDPQYEKSTDKYELQLNSAFGSDCTNLMKNFKINFWIFGHTHYSTLQKCNETIIVSNQLGYLFNENDKSDNWREDFCIDVEKGLVNDKCWKDVKEFDTFVFDNKEGEEKVDNYEEDKMDMNEY
ncbi:hypothetical protein ABK040_015873 [Willaertia magna]